MNTLYERLAKIGSIIVVILLAMYFYPDYWIELLLAATTAFLFDYTISRSRMYRSLKPLQQFKEKILKWKMERELDKILKEESREKYRKKLIENALGKAKSIDKSEREMGLEQIVQFGTEDTYEKLSDILKNTKLTKSHEMQIIETLYKLKNVNKR